MTTEDNEHKILAKDGLPIRLNDLFRTTDGEVEIQIIGINGVIKDLPSEITWLMTSHVFMKQIKLFIYGE